MSSVDSKWERFVFYGRRSTKGKKKHDGRERQEASLPDQLAWARPECERRRYRIVKEFVDEGVRGGAIESRPGFVALVAFCEAEADAGRPVDGIVNWNGDRFSRANSFRTGGVIDRLMGAGVTLMLTPRGLIDFENTTDRMIYNIEQDAAREGLSRTISENVSRAMRQRALRGEWLGSAPPPGYAGDPETRKLTPGDPARIDLVRRMFRLYGDTPASLEDVALSLNADGLRTARGNRWTGQAVLRVISNRRYLGEAIWAELTKARHFRPVSSGLTEPPDGKARKVRERRGGLANFPAVANGRDEVIVVPGAHPALIDPATFARCEAKRASNKKHTSPRGSSRAAPLSGLLYCGDCKKAMYGCRLTKVYKGKRSYYDKYVCGKARRGHGCRWNGVDQAEALARLLGWLAEKLSTPQALVELRAEAARVGAIRQQEGNAARARLEAEVAALGVDLKNAGGKLARLPEDVHDLVLAAIHDMRAEHARKSAELAALDLPADVPALAESVKDAAERLPGLALQAGAAPAALVRAAVERLVESATVIFRREAGRRAAQVERLDVVLTPAVEALLGLQSRHPDCRMSEVSRLAFTIPWTA